MVLLDDDVLLMSSAAPRTTKLFEQRGYRVTGVDISEFEKLEGCVTCLSVRLRGRPDVTGRPTPPPVRESSSDGRR